MSIDFGLPQIDRLKGVSTHVSLGCTHCGAPLSQRVYVEDLRDNLLRGVIEEKEFLLWVTRTLVDQVVFKYFDEKNGKWLASKFGGAPLPVEPAGMGCVRVMSPFDLYKIGSDCMRFSDTTVALCRNYLSLSIEFLNEICGISKEEFMNRVKASGKNKLHSEKLLDLLD